MQELAEVARGPEQQGFLDLWSGGQQAGEAEKKQMLTQVGAQMAQARWLVHNSAFGTHDDAFS